MTCEKCKHQEKEICEKCLFIIIIMEIYEILKTEGSFQRTIMNEILEQLFLAWKIYSSTTIDGFQSGCGPQSVIPCLPASVSMYKHRQKILKDLG